MRPASTVAPAVAGSVLIGPDALRLLTRHLESRRHPDDPATLTVYRQLIALSRACPVVPTHVAPMPTITPPLTVGTAEAAQRLGITTDAVRKRIHRRQIDAWSDGRRWRIPTSQLE